MFKPAKTIYDRIKAMTEEEAYAFTVYVKYYFDGNLMTLLESPASLFDAILREVNNGERTGRNLVR